MKYDAFITYRHIEPDSMIAEKLHKKLEHYHIPKKIRKESGKSRISRVFRDREELPLSSDLSEDIENALADSEYLILICSPESLKSAWVQREVNMFVEFHGRENVLTILAKGEPQESFPKILCEKTEVTVDENGKETSIKIQVEPMAADVRAMNEKEMQKKLDVEFLRIVAAMLGCSFDDLRLRHRQYRMKQAAAIIGGSLALATGVLAVVTGMSRAKYREEWLRLAEYSKNAMEAGDTYLALQYAMDSLHKTSNLFQPVYQSESRKALTDALGVYDLSDGYKFVKTIQLPSQPLFMQIAPDGLRAAAICSGFVVVVDTDSGEILAQLPADPSACSQVRFLDADTIVYAGTDGICAYNAAEQKELWRAEPATSISVSADGSRVAGIYKDNTYAMIYDSSDCEVIQKVDFGDSSQSVMVNDIFLNTESQLFALDGTGELLAVSFADGSVCVYNVDTPRNFIEIYDENSGFTGFEGGFSGDYLVFSAYDQEKCQLHVENLATGNYGFFGPESYRMRVQADEQQILLKKDNQLFECTFSVDKNTELLQDDAKLLISRQSDTIHAFDSDGRHTVIGTKDHISFFDENVKSIGSYHSGYYVDYALLAADTAVIGSIDSPVLKILKYQTKQTSRLLAYNPTFLHTEARVSQDESTIMLFSGNSFCLYDRDGNEIMQMQLEDSEHIYDTQYRRNDRGSYLEVTYVDGRQIAYSAADGSLLFEKQEEIPDPSLLDIFETRAYRIERAAHGNAVVYEKQTGKQLGELKEDAYLTYVTEAGDYILLQYVTTFRPGEDRYYFGKLLNQKLEVLADLPYLCDVMDGMLYFDLPAGSVVKSPIYDLPQLMELGRDSLE